MAEVVGIIVVVTFVVGVVWGFEVAFIVVTGDFAVVGVGEGFTDLVVVGVMVLKLVVAIIVEAIVADEVVIVTAASVVVTAVSLEIVVKVGLIDDAFDDNATQLVRETRNTLISRKASSLFIEIPSPYRINVRPPIL